MPSPHSADHSSNARKRTVSENSKTDRARPLSCTARDLYTSLRSRRGDGLDLPDLAFFTDIRLLEALRRSPSEMENVADAIRAGIRVERRFVKNRAANASERIRKADEQKIRALRCIPNGLDATQRHESARASLIESWHLAYLEPDDAELVACKARRAGRLAATTHLSEWGPSEPVRRAMRRIYLASEIHVLAEALTERARTLDLPFSHRCIIEKELGRTRELSESRVRMDHLQRHVRRYRTRIDHILTRHFELNHSALRQARRLIRAVIGNCILPGSQLNGKSIALRPYGHFLDRCERKARRLVSSGDSEEHGCILLALLMPE